MKWSSLIYRVVAMQNARSTKLIHCIGAHALRPHRNNMNTNPRIPPFTSALRWHRSKATQHAPHTHTHTSRIFYVECEAACSVCCAPSPEMRNQINYNFIPCSLLRPFNVAALHCEWKILFARAHHSVAFNVFFFCFQFLCAFRVVWEFSMTVLSWPPPRLLQSYAFTICVEKCEMIEDELKFAVHGSIDTGCTLLQHNSWTGHSQFSYECTRPQTKWRMQRTK